MSRFTPPRKRRIPTKERSATKTKKAKRTDAESSSTTATTVTTSTFSWSTLEDISPPIKAQDKYHPIRQDIAVDDTTEAEQHLPTLDPEWWESDWTWEYPLKSRSQPELPSLPPEIYNNQEEVNKWYILINISIYKNVGITTKE